MQHSAWSPGPPLELEALGSCTPLSSAVLPATWLSISITAYGLKDAFANLPSHHDDIHLQQGRQVRAGTSIYHEPESDRSSAVVLADTAANLRARLGAFASEIGRARSRVRGALLRLGRRESIRLQARLGRCWSATCFGMVQLGHSRPQILLARPPGSLQDW